MSNERPTYPLLIEESSNYAFTVRRMAKPLSFDKLRNTSNRFYNDLPEEIRDELHNSILHGTCMLSSEPELNAYMHDMGKMHNAKLRKAYENLPGGIWSYCDMFCTEEVKCIDIIDYGCGQGLGIIAFADHMREASKSVNVRRIVLIEPSEIALRRAALHASVLFPNVELVTINKGFDDLVDGDIFSDEDIPTLHILSNVLDLAKTELVPNGYFDLNRFADLISANIKGENQFVGVEPLFNHSDTDEKFPRFWKRVGISQDYKLICNKGEFVPGKNWTCVIVCGTKNNESLFQRLHRDYWEVGELSDGVICVGNLYRGEYGCAQHFYYGYVDELGNEIIPCEYSDANPFRNGLAFVKNGHNDGDNKWGAINKQGEIVIPYIYESIEWDDDENIIASIYSKHSLYPKPFAIDVDCAVSTSFDGKYGYDKYDKNGNLIGAAGRIIEYTSTDGNIVVPHSPEAFDAKIISNTYKDGIGKIVFDKPITSIGWSAFYDCDGLKSITIPNSVTSIGWRTFSGCKSLTGITIPNSVTEIGEWAFTYCSSLTSITIPNSVTEIDRGAFYGCDGLTSINIPDSVTVIGRNAFSACKNMINVTISKGVANIGEEAFAGCKSLVSITIPDSITEIGDRAFRSCDSLLGFYGKFASSDNRSLIVGGELKAFAPANLTSYLIPESVTSIGNDAFCGCIYLISVTLPDSLCSIGDRAFLGCSSLESIKITNSVASIGEMAFYNCSSLTSVTIPNGVKYIGKDAFACFTKLWPESNYELYDNSITKVNIEDLLSWLKIDFANEGANPMFSGAELYINRRRVADVVIPYGIKTIKNYTFCGGKFNSVTIPADISIIGKGAFGTSAGAVRELDGFTKDWHSNIQKVIIKDLSAWCRIDFGGDGSNPLSEHTKMYLNDTEIKDLVIPMDVDSIAFFAFHAGNFESITIHSGVKSISPWAFSGCKGKLYIDCEITEDEIADEYFSHRELFGQDIDNEFSEIEIGPTVQVVNRSLGAFLMNNNIKSITIPDNVLSIEERAFECYDNLEHITIGYGITHIGAYVFEWCKHLHTIECNALIPPTLESNSLQISSFGDGSFSGKIYVPKQSVELYKSASGWSEHADRIFAIESDYNISPSQKLETKEVDANTVNVDNIELYPQQQEALDAICAFLKSEDQIFILKGYAGTGKTTMIKAMLPILRNMGKHTTLMAPTGRAAKVLMTKTGREASTIHRTIYSVNKLTSVRHDENGELIKMVDYIYKDKEETRKHDVVEFWFGINQERYADYNPQNAVYIVDEASMVSSRKTSNELFHFGSDVLLDDLLEYAELLKGGKIIFIGDPAQLPPVGDNCSAALSEVYFKEKGIGVTSFELTNVVRQSADSVILENAMMLRDLLQTQPRNTLTFKRCDNEVEDVLATTMVAKYIEMYPEPAFGDTAIICYSNKMAKGYNDAIRTYYYPGEKSVQAGDILQVVKNYYRVDDASQSRDALYNGDFVRVLDVSSEVETQSAPVWTKPGNKREVISLAFRDVTVQTENGEIYKLKIIDSLLNSTNPCLTPNEHTALYINFRMRNPNLPKDKEAQAKMLMEDPYYNALNVKFGYAITGHKSQGGDWDTVFVDYNGRTGLDNDSLRWMYTATTRAKERLYGVNMPNIQPFDKLQFRPITKLNKPAANAQIVGNVGNVDMLSSNASNSQKAKCLSIISALSRIGCRVDKIEQLQYKDRYHIRVNDVVEKYDCTYNGAGYYTAYNALDASENNKAIIEALQSEECYTYQFDYSSSHKVLVDLHAKMRSICDELGVSITNIVEDIKQYNVVYFLKTTGKYSYIKFYFDKNMFVTYGHPYSDIEAEDVLLNEIIAKLS